jgi:hypothetical protein
MVNWQGTLFLGFVNEKWKDGGRTNPKLFVVISKVQIQEGGRDGDPFCLPIHVVIKSHASYLCFNKGSWCHGIYFIDIK